MDRELTKAEISLIGKLLAAISVNSFRDLITKYISDAFVTSHENTNVEFNFGRSKPDPLGIEYIRERELILSDKTTSKLEGDLKYELITGLQNNESIDQITRRLDHIFTDMMPWQLERIARSEVVDAQNAGRISAYHASDVVEYKMWVATKGGTEKRVCALCTSLHGQVQPIDKPFVNPNNPAESWQHPICHPNGRCTTVPLMDLPDNVIRIGGLMYDADEKLGKVEIPIDLLKSQDKTVSKLEITTELLNKKEITVSGYTTKKGVWHPPHKRKIKVKTPQNVTEEPTSTEVIDVKEDVKESQELKDARYVVTSGQEELEKVKVRQGKIIAMNELVVQDSMDTYAELQAEGADVATLDAAQKEIQDSIARVEDAKRHAEKVIRTDEMEGKEDQRKYDDLLESIKTTERLQHNVDKAKKDYDGHCKGLEYANNRLKEITEKHDQIVQDVKSELLKLQELGADENELSHAQSKVKGCEERRVEAVKWESDIVKDARVDMNASEDLYNDALKEKIGNKKTIELEKLKPWGFTTNMTKENVKEEISLNDMGATGGINNLESSVLTFNDDSHAIYKTSDEASNIGEVMAYDVSRIIGWDVVPETTSGDFGRGEGSCQKWIEGGEHPEYRPWMEDDEGGILREDHIDDLAKILVLDMVNGNDDRHQANVVVKGDRVYAIDSERIGQYGIGQHSYEALSGNEGHKMLNWIKYVPIPEFRDKVIAKTKDHMKTILEKKSDIIDLYSVVASKTVLTEVRKNFDYTERYLEDHP